MSLVLKVFFRAMIKFEGKVMKANMMEVLLDLNVALGILILILILAYIILAKEEQP